MAVPTTSPTKPPLTRRQKVTRGIAGAAVLGAVATGVVQCPGRQANQDSFPPDRAGSPTERVVRATYGTIDGDGEFRTNCQRAHYNRADRIVYPGQPLAAHVHMYFGADGVDADTDPIDSRGSTCEGGVLNKTGYWVPAMIDGNDNIVDAANVRDAIQVYYKNGYRGITGRMVQPFPAGLKMIAGDAKAGQIADTTKVWWTCQPTLTINQGIAHEREIPNRCNGYIQAAIEFPQCWDGKNLDAADHKSHMSYGLGWPDRGCGNNADGTPKVALPQITEFIRWPAPANGDTSAWHIASDIEGAPDGSSLHADWFNGWDPNTMEKIVRNCLQPEIDCRMNLLGDGTMLTNDPEVGRSTSARGNAPTGDDDIPPVTSTTVPVTVPQPSSPTIASLPPTTTTTRPPG